jgi:hypothetical protein
MVPPVVVGTPPQGGGSRKIQTGQFPDPSLVRIFFVWAEKTAGTRV